MKKLRIFIMSLLVLTLGTVLVACGFKKPEVSFTQGEIALSFDESRNFDDLVVTKNVEKKNITFKLENPSLFEVEGRTITAGQKAGKSYIYAIYKKNILSSMKIVIKEKFNAPTFADNPLSHEGVFSWDAVSGYFDGQVVPATQYRVEGQCLVYSATDPSLVQETIQISETVSQPNFTLTQYGVYHLKVTALGTGYFDDSAPSEEQTLAFGYMAPAQNFEWDSESGQLSWDSAEEGDAEYVIKFDGVEFPQRTSDPTVSLKERLNSVGAGQHIINIITYDRNETLLAVESEMVVVTKLELPHAEYVFDSQNGGRIKLSTDEGENVESFAVEFEGESSDAQTLFVDNESKENFSTFDDLDAGLYTVKIFAKPVSEGGFFFQSGEVEFGKIYKLPTATISGTGANAPDGTNFGASLVSDQIPVDVLLNVNRKKGGVDSFTYVEGFQKDQTNFDFQFPLTDAGEYRVSIRQMPVAESNTVGEEEVYVINSAESNTISATKVGQTSGQYVHSYREQDGHSVLTFEKVEYAQSYVLQINSGVSYADVEAGLYEVQVGEQNIEIILNGKIEDLFSTVSRGGKDIYDLRIVCKAESDEISIDSTLTREPPLERLKAPATNHAGNSDNKTYSWQEVAGAGNYDVQIYKIEKGVYDANKESPSINIDTALLENLGQKTSTLSIDIEEVGYYYAKVYALSSDENSYISSGTALEEVFFICEQLEISNVDFAEGEDGFYIAITNADNIANYEVFLNGDSLGTPAVEEGEKTKFKIGDALDRAEIVYTIEVVAHAENEEIYNASARYSFEVQRLPKVARADIEISELTLQANPTDLSTESTAQELSINATAGARGVKIWDGHGTTAGSETEKSARLSIEGKSPIELNFVYYGSEQQGEVYVKTENKIYLTGETAQFVFTRVQTPTNLAYYSGKLRFDHTAVTAKDYYVLTIVCVGLNGQAENITVKFADNVTAQHGADSATLGRGNDYVATMGSVVQIDFEKVLAELQETPALAKIYNQSAKVGFAVFAFQDRQEDGQGVTNVTICSDFATTSLDAQKTICVVEKMSQTSLEIDLDTSETDFILKWGSVEANPSYESETRYQVFENGEELDEAISACSKNLVKSGFVVGTYYEYYVVAQNPYYVQSGASNIIRIFKLSPIESVQLFEDGAVGYGLTADQREFVKNVKVTKPEGSEENTTGKIEISRSGTLKLQVVGNKDVDNGGNKKTYYIDSEEKEWTLAEMQTLKPLDETVTFEENTISWNAFAESENLQNLRYVLMFKDENNNTATYKTTQTRENLTRNADLYNSLSNLAGQIEIKVTAYLETFPVEGASSSEATYTINAGKTIYFAKNVTLPVGEPACNYYVYTGSATVNKYETPQVSNVTFTTSSNLVDADLPTIKVEFVGNYGSSRSFDIYLNGEFYKTETISRSGEKYSFNLLPADYNQKVENGQTLTIGICALSDTDIRSSIGQVEVVRAEEVQNIEFVTNDQDELTHTIKITLPQDNTSGGVVVNVAYETVDGKTGEEYVLVPVNEILGEVEYDLSEIINKTDSGAKVLAKGGKVTLSAHVSSFSGAGKYILACPTWTDSTQYQILATVNEVEKTSGGFVIDAETNSQDVIYIIECNNTIFEVRYNDDRFYFEFPHGGQWQNGTYNLSIYAKQEGYLPSVTGDVEFNLNKLTALSDIKVLRDQDDLSSIKLSWSAVSNATGYVFRMYAKEDTTRINLLYEYVTATTNCSFVQMFGEGYQDLLDFGKVDAFTLMNDKDVFFDVFAQGDVDRNDSDIYSFNATIKGNSLEIANISVNEYGVIVLNCTPGETYLYRFVGSDDSVLQKWTKLTATSDYEKIDTKGIVAEGGTYFNMEVVVVGKDLSEEISTKLSGLYVDSLTFTTSGSGTTFVVGTDIVNVGYIESEGNTDLSFELVTGSFTKLYVGLSEDALMNEQVAEFVPNFVAAGEQNDQGIYSFNLSLIVDRLKEKGLSVIASGGDITLYFWSFRMILVDDTENSFCISHAKTCKFTYTTDIGFVKIAKLGKELSDTSKFMEDYANVFAVFNNDDASASKTTFGIYVKITPLDQQSQGEDSSDEDFSDEDLPPEEDDEEGGGRHEEGVGSYTAFVSKAELTSANYFQDGNYFVINLTTVFESTDFTNLAGRFKFEFATLSVKDVGGAKQFVLSDWVGQFNDQELIFNKLQNIARVDLLDGSLTWINAEEGSQKYYVYFADSLGENNSIGDSFVYDVVTTNKYVTVYNASDFVGVGESYYLAVRAINEDLYTLPSSITFVKSADGTPAKVEKNEIRSPLKIENGRIYIPFVEGDDPSIKYGGSGTDFVDFVKNCSESTDTAQALVNRTFHAPFSFTLANLINGAVRVRFRFTPISGALGMTQTFDVDARYLVSSMFEIEDEFDYENKLTTMQKHIVSGGGAISNFIELMKDGSFGVGNYKAMVDEFFDSLQSGEYKLDYCLLGNSTSLTSGWYSYSNNGENSIYINNEPKIQAIKTTAVGGYNSANSYKILLKKSEIFNKVGGALSSEIAESYVMKIYNDVGDYYAFSIGKAGRNYSMMMYENVDDKTVTVYETNEFGVETEGGDYLMFYLNMNDANSILGRFSDKISRGNYKMQIFAIGNNYSLSSKSSVFNLTLYGFGSDFTLNNGEFTWTAQRNSKTTVVYKKHSSVGETVSPTPVQVTSSKARYSLDETGYGLYDYVDFLIVGEVSGNNIFVDSEVYRVENVYKLQSPTASNTKGLIMIDDRANATLEGVDAVYSDLNLYNYKIYNNISNITNGLTFVDEGNAQAPIYYEAGTTGMGQMVPEAEYKETEVEASAFYVASMGSSASFNITSATGEEQYFVKILKFVNKTGASLDGGTVGVAVRSNYSTLSASMIDQTSGLAIQDGILTWTEVTGRRADELSISPNEKVIYKVTVVQYDLSYDDDGEIENDYPNTLEYYTAETEFDFARIDEEKLNKSAKYMRATVQALAMNYSKSAPAVDIYLPLVEGGYAYGNVRYADSTRYVLMGNGDVFTNIERTQPIDEGSLQVVDGRLVWTVTFEEEVGDLSTFGDRYHFAVIDENFNEVSGQLTFDAGANAQQVKVTFIEDAGQLEAKTQILSVYMTKVDEENRTIKSFGREIEVTKLATVHTEDYAINSDERDSNVEILDFSAYFELNPSNEIRLSIYQSSEKIDEPSLVVFTARRSKLYILGHEDSNIDGNATGFAGKFVVSNEGKLILNFVVANISLQNCLFSDVSEDIILQRSSWGSGTIIWDSTKQRFEWTYDGFNALGTSVVDAEQVEKVLRTNKLATLYADQDLQIPAYADEAQVTIPNQTEIIVEETYDNSSLIYYQEQRYYISNDDYGEAYKSVGNEKLSAGTLFRVVETYNDTQTVIATEKGEMFVILTSLVTEPVYIVEATYGEGIAAIVRTYTTTDKFFTPTIIGKVSIKVKIKLSASNIQSQELVYEDGASVDFDLFSSGQGTVRSPYYISNETQFRNIAYRLSKDRALTRYTETGIVRSEDEKYYFSLQGDITLSSTITGILFGGTFTGEIEGNDHTITYQNSGISRLTGGDITVNEGNILSATDAQSTTITYGASLFETLSSSAVVKNLKLSVALKQPSAAQYITSNSLISGLTITNQGRIENVQLVGFSSDFVGFTSKTTKLMMIYSGIASINVGGEAVITGCKMNADMQFNDYDNAQLIFVGGIAFTNRATIENCVAGDETTTKSITVIGLSESDAVQVAGIVVTNAIYSTLKGCHNYANITVSAQYDNDDFVVYIAGITDYARGTVQDNANHGTITATNILDRNLHKGEVSADEA